MLFIAQKPAPIPRKNTPLRFLPAPFIWNTGTGSQMLTHLSAAKTVVGERTHCGLVLAGYPVYVLSPAVAAVRDKNQHLVWVETAMIRRLASQPTKCAR